MDNLKSTAGSLDALLKAIEDPTPGWDNDDPGAVLAHQLGAPLLHDLARLDGIDMQAVSHASTADLTIQSFGQLFLADDPPRLLLEAAKDYFKPSAHKPGGPIPQQVALVLYYAAIVSAHRAGQPPLSTMPIEQITQGVAWAKGRRWLAPQLAELFETPLESKGAVEP